MESCPNHYEKQHADGSVMIYFQRWPKSTNFRK